MAQQVKVLKVQARWPEFDPCNPHEGGRREFHKVVLWLPQLCQGICGHICTCARTHTHTNSKLKSKKKISSYIKRRQETTGFGKTATKYRLGVPYEHTWDRTCIRFCESAYTQWDTVQMGPESKQEASLLLLHTDEGNVMHFFPSLM